MTQQTINEEGAFQRTQRVQINNNFTELFDAVIDNFTITNAADLAATGTNQATGAAITANVVNVTAADGTKAVVLPTAALGKVVFVYNSVATNGLPVFPASGAAINGGTGDAAVTIEGKTLAIFVGTSATNWAAIFTANT